MSQGQGRTVDGILIAWGERWDWAPTQRKGRIPKSGIPVIPMKGQRGGVTAHAVRQTLRAFVRRHPQVVVKISGGGKGMKAIVAHFAYISRHGDVALEDQDGQRIAGQEDLDTLREQWAYGHYPIADESHRREAFNIILSMPEGTDRDAVLRAARDFAHDAFGEQHDYVFANHVDEPHPHVHLTVKARGRDGTRLNPRKGDLRAWRVDFAQKLRDHGVEAVASKRSARLHRSKGEKQAIRKIRERGQKPRNDVTAKQQPASVLRARKNAERAMNDFKVVAQALAGSPHEDDRALAIEIVRVLPQMRPAGKTVQVDVTSRAVDRDREG